MSSDRYLGLGKIHARFLLFNDAVLHTFPGQKKGDRVFD
jgi:hypothetical protein